MCASSPWVLRSFVCHTQLEKSLMRSWEEVGVVCKEVRWRKGKRKYYCQKYLCQKYFQKKCSPKIIFSAKYIFKKKYFCQKYFWKNNLAKIFSKKILLPNTFSKKVGAKPPCSPQGLGWYRAIARSQPSCEILTPFSQIIC